uniref:AlNc14C118G6576 protein n=1 Tax=Albugo laibachii Nc14 TaxID=890382 RepID=F0WJ45_9STRA|nr:AlNc14C118G6576 [Albugo laibachii Nc14]|eukprot:CCA21291.1 AlNc14C118G6576 [Albugo laibachii Nc14]
MLDSCKHSRTLPHFARALHFVTSLDCRIPVLNRKRGDQLRHDSDGVPIVEYTDTFVRPVFIKCAQMSSLLSYSLLGANI